MDTASASSDNDVYREHRCEILAGPLGYVAVCPCGWGSGYRASALAAERTYTMLHAWEVLEDD